ncbi:5-Enolpyruvylshikimate-3-phosphate synthase [alpha proteobacterium U9-1i]|nr:5-Enolpyruvylshikimate-3-phosphate synthase [alpha proteobacterium U9-1i]
MRLTARAGARGSGQIHGRGRPPGDKSISHRALILGGLAEGETAIEGLLEGDDVLRTAAAVRALGADVGQLGGGRWRVTGAAGFNSPAEVLDCGNSGTGVRLLMGAAAGYPLTAHFDGDASLRRRPMGRIAEPLRLMGAAFDGERLPLTLRGGSLTGIVHHSPVASAQIKSAVLLAGLNADGETVVVEPAASRDHTERMLKAFGADIDSVDGAPRVRRSRLQASPVSVPADPSSAAFPLAAALIAGGEVRLDGVMMNALRVGLFDTLVEMGADIAFENRREQSGEAIADIVVRRSALKAAAPPAARVPSMIDEYPILAALAAFADGETRLIGAEELRVKESDRIALMVAGLRACGVDAEELPDGLIVRGGGPNGVRGGAEIVTHGDHRIAMSFLVLGLASREPVSVDEADMINTSFPGFAGFMRALGADIS